MTGRRLKIEAEYEKETIRIWLFHQDVFVVGGITGCYTVSVGK